jgi:hypothetical protein
MRDVFLGKDIIQNTINIHNHRYNRHIKFSIWKIY